MSWENYPSHSLAAEIMEPYFQSAERDQLLQKYTYLTIESERLKQRISSTLSVYSSTYTGLSGLTPSSSRQSKSPSPSVSSPSSRRTSTSDRTPLYPAPQSHGATIEEDDEQALLCIQQQIKATLTGLLNCKEVKCDQAARGWVQQRLMDAEQEMRTRKRRRRSGSESLGGGVLSAVMGKRNVV